MFRTYNLVITVQTNKKVTFSNNPTDKEKNTNKK